MKSTSAALLVAIAATLAGCGETPPDAEPTEQATAPVVQVANGVGTITAIDPGAGTVTLDHREIPEINWPEMVMTFKAEPALLTGLKPGDRVGFELTLTDGQREVTALAKE